MATKAVFRALITPTKKTLAAVEPLSRSDLPSISNIKQSRGQECDLTIQVSYSNLNFKDALIVTGKYPGLKTPMVGGIDLVGTVVEATASSRFRPGDSIMVNGFGIGSDHYGGYAEEARIPSSFALALPHGLTELDAAKIGTAGYTSMLCVDALAGQGVKPADGPILVTGSTGGVGSIAVILLSQLGFEVVALSGKAKDPESTAYLQSLGASSVRARSDLEGEPKALNKEQYAGCVDTAGGKVLANALSMIKYGGSVAACGLAAGLDLPTTVAPFILRNVSLMGIESALQTHETRQHVYSTYGPLLVKSRLLEKVCDDSRIISLEEVPQAAQDMLEGKIRGRYVVRLLNQSRL